MATIKLFSGNSLRAVMGELAPAFEKATGHQIEASYDPAKMMMERLARGEAPDLILLNRSAIADLVKAGHVVPDSVRPVLSCGVGVAVGKGAPKPDIGTLDAFKRTLLAAKSVAWTSHGTSGIYFSGLIERLGMAEPLKAKAVLQPGGLVGELVVAGKAELAIQQIPELMAVAGVDFVGPLPREIQNVTNQSIGLFASSKEPAAARMLVDFMTSPEAKQMFQARGFETA
jgi:molybdate transport system substrate-binding protein